MLSFFLAFGLSAALTRLVRRVAVQRGWVAKPMADRWHTTPTALMGGVAIFAAFALGLATAPVLAPDLSLGGYAPLFLCAALVFVLGLVDDLYHLSPQTKLVGQVIAAALLVFFGFKVNWFVSFTLNTFVSVLWIVGVTNAFNLLDNMDGLAAGIAIISSFFVALIALASPAHGAGDGQVMILALFMGAVLGFLLYNFHPASIFMGDCGSLFIGFVLAGVTTEQRLFRSGQFLPIIAVPVCILFIPILDTGFVSVMRTFFRRSIATGGKDHSSHRLVAIGLTERTAVLTLYGFAGAGGMVALVGALYRAEVFVTCLVLYCLVSLFFWIYLARVRVYPEEERSLIERSRTLTTFWVNFTYERRVFEVLLDVFLISFGYWLSYVLRFEGDLYVANFPMFLKSLPIAQASLLTTYVLFGVYRGVWRYTSVTDLVTYVKAVTSGVVLSMLVILFVYRFEAYSRTVFVIYWGILLFFLAGSRLSFRMIAASVRRNSVANGKRVLIYGAGDKGEMTLREILNNQALGLTPVGFIDDDVRKHRKRIQGYKVLGGKDRLAHLASKYQISEVIIASGKIIPDHLESVKNVCEQKSITVRTMEVAIK
ncbi:MAG TPA: glycosyl transferase [Syntrophobacteria bacterium]|nr:glycosyl transferase [Syntrophobacteria bacterium]